MGAVPSAYPQFGFIVTAAHWRIAVGEAYGYKRRSWLAQMEGEAGE